MDPKCNICECEDFAEFAGRPDERCTGCGAMRRHRVAFALYERHGMLDRPDSWPSHRRVLHFAPEAVLGDRIRAVIGSGYVPADAMAEVYGKAKALRLFLPDDLGVFPDEYFDFVIHNHVLEHVPGSFRDHLLAFCRILTIGGKMIFSIPGPKMNQDTVEGGEHFATDEDRMAAFGQVDHLKVFGRDLPEYLASIPGGEFAFDDLSDDERAQIAVAPNSNRFLVWEKTGPVEAAQRAVPEKYAAGVGRTRTP